MPGQIQSMQAYQADNFLANWIVEVKVDLPNTEAPDFFAYALVMEVPTGPKYSGLSVVRNSDDPLQIYDANITNFVWVEFRERRQQRGYIKVSLYRYDFGVLAAEPDDVAYLFVQNKPPVITFATILTPYLSDEVNTYYIAEFYGRILDEDVGDYSLASLDYSNIPSSSPGQDPGGLAVLVNLDGSWYYYWGVITKGEDAVFTLTYTDRYGLKASQSMYVT